VIVIMVIPTVRRLDEPLNRSRSRDEEKNPCHSDLARFDEP
jgi:hypothetical protein